MINFWRSLRFTIVFALLLGLIYPLVITGIGNLLFPYQAKGSMVMWRGQVVGSQLIAQETTVPWLFHPRPSAVHYEGNNSGGSNLGPTNPALIAAIRHSLHVVLKENPGTTVSQIPTEMVESSASGLDPDISIPDALIQVPRIARATGLSNSYLKGLIATYTEGRTLGIWGEPMVNVMQLNMEIVKRTGR
ncbi:MAG: potassium-transporting ATPase subunit KdpC [Acidibacillus sp.]|uniref:Potassium-transporting ATPase KdpC subunit n=1 Tax=Sulfoacidibacillus ferrooxidans TaxID=2005001 RepID=A0A9X2AB84_9BACL|nr:potassium-transporting ATPase subunit KdpC [Sulfoacidibacillus ferrooxidans]MCI0182663.1 Potassium-transporting ATPase KdpC subunit [Sulfoacidibacillus ferrooxidans]MCY0894065.1 potassium-transporting ATPase subunit KdpC [Acidibacillus sp.]